MAINLHFGGAGMAKGIVNAGTGKARSFNDIAQTLIAHLGQGRIEYIPFPDALRGKYQSFTQADVRSLPGGRLHRPLHRAGSWHRRHPGRDPLRPDSKTTTLAEGAERKRGTQRNSNSWFR